MKFHISGLKLNISIDGWTNEVVIPDTALTSLQDLELRGGVDAELTIEAEIDVASFPYTLLIPISLICLPGKETISMDIPSWIKAKRKDKLVDVKVIEARFSYVDLTPLHRAVGVVLTRIQAV